MTHATMTPAELLELAHGSPIQGFEALQETLPLRQSPVKWNGFDQASYPPLLYENVAENATAPPSQKRKRRGRQAKKPTRQPPEEVLSPLSDEGESAKRMKLSSPVKPDDKSVRRSYLCRQYTADEMYSLPNRLLRTTRLFSSRVGWSTRLQAMPKHLT